MFIEAKLKFGGSHAGHNGLRDIHAQMGSDQYWRLRLGIGHPGNKAEVVNWVLQKPAPDRERIVRINRINIWLAGSQGVMQVAIAAPQNQIRRNHDPADHHHHQ